MSVKNSFLILSIEKMEHLSYLYQVRMSFQPFQQLPLICSSPLFSQGVKGVLRGSTKITRATFTSPGMGVPVTASIPHRPMGNQPMKFVTAMVISRRAIVMSFDLLVEVTFKVLPRIDQ